MASIRSYRSSDEDNIIHIFRETASSDLKEAGDPTLHYASYNWARPYIMLRPDTCWVIDDGNGIAVGYLFGVPDTQSFVTDYRARYLPRLTSQGLEKPKLAEGVSRNDLDLPTSMQYITWSPEDMLHQHYPNLLKQYPAHLHIDILPAYQGQGWGTKLILKMLDTFRDMNVAGVHLGKVGSNFGAGKFYAKLGFDRYAEVMDGGQSGERGRVKDGGVYMVKEI